MVKCDSYPVIFHADVATAVLDKCVHRKQNSDGSVLVTYNYEFLDDIPHDFSDDLESIYDDDDDDDDDGDEIFDERLFSEDPEPMYVTSSKLHSILLNI